MVRARLPFTKKFQPKFSVFSGVPTPSECYLIPSNSLGREMGAAFVHIGNMFYKVGIQGMV